MNTNDTQIGNTDNKDNATPCGGKQAKEMGGVNAVNDSAVVNTDEVRTAAGSQEKQSTENATTAPTNDNGTPVSPMAEKKSKAKRGAEVVGKAKGDTISEGNTPTADQLLSPTLAKLKVIELGRIVPLDDLVSGQIRDKEFDSKRVEFFAAKYRAGEWVPRPVAIRVPGKPKDILGDGHRRALGKKAAGFDKMEVDLYEGTELDVINVGLELNSNGPAPLKQTDLVKAAAKMQALGVRPNITKLADMLGTSRKTAREKYNAEISKTGSVLDVFKPVKPRKTKEEIADAIAIRVLEAIEEGNDEVITAIFDKLPDDTRQHHVQALYKLHGGPARE